jgi:hypothetical protein
MHLSFDKSWDWLMPVVEKIAKIDNYLYPDGMYKYFVQVELNVTTGVAIEDMYGEGLVAIQEYEADSFVLNTYNAVVKFIKWYNETRN